MASLNPGDKVKWRYPEPSADPNELHGTIVQIQEITYLVKWNDGTQEIEDGSDLKLDTDA